ncbi:MAG: Na+/H+ antiporter subunit G [Proteobacteria bacterium]|jgi:multicomponent K+:H+ antiporter subunit G|nr:Na+/H+ antiporter subunit G [Pseudomonadota bacterium]
MNAADAPLWVEVLVALLLLVSAVMALTSAIGLVRLRDFFARMHMPALTATLGVWCVTLAAVVYFSALRQGLSLSYWLVSILMAITVPVTTVMLARAALFRLRGRHDPGIPPPVQARSVRAPDQAG